MFRSYRKKIKVDCICAINDLEAIGTLPPNDIASLRADYEGRLKKKRKKKELKREQELQNRFPYSDGDFLFIAGHTSGGAPYGVTWHEMGLKTHEDLFGEYDEHDLFDEYDGDDPF